MRGLLSRGLVLAMLSVSPACGHALANIRHALVIGNDTYPGDKLINARNDARAVAQKLEGLGYQTTLSLDLDRRAMESGIDRFSASLSPGDVALVYYAGHGLQVDGENYLVPTDFRVSQQADVKFQGYPLSALLQNLTSHGATTEVIILDACRNNPFLGSRSLSGGWASTATSAGMFLAFGTAPGSTAEDNPSQHHGLFTQSLLKFLSSSGDIQQMFQDVRLDVVQQSGGQQVPWIASSLVGSFHVNPVGDSGATPILGAMADASPAGGAGLSGLNRALVLSDPSLAAVPVSGSAAAIDTSSIDDAEALSEAISAARGLHFDKAISILKAVLSIDPRCALALRLIGAIYHLTGRGVEAGEALDQAIRNDPSDALAYSYKCLIDTARGDGPSEPDCREAARLGGNLPEAHLGLALSLASGGDRAAAYAEAARAVALDPGSTASLALRGELSVAQANHRSPQRAFPRVAEPE